MTQQQNNPMLSNAIALLLCSAGMCWGVTIPNPVLGIPVSLGSYAALDAHRRKYKYELRNVLGECVSASTPLLESTAESLKANHPGDDAGPITKYGYKLLMGFLGDRSVSDYAWFENMQFGLGVPGLMPYGVWLVCGEQREGKTMSAKHLFGRYIEQHPGCQVLICDVENESHPEDYWFGCPVADTPAKVVQAFREIAVYLDQSKGDGSDPGLVVMFDEVKTTFNSLNNKDRAFIIKTLQDCHSRGAKRKVLMLNIMHTLTGAVLQWPGITDFAPKANILMLQRFAADDANFMNLQASEGLQDARDEIAGYDIIPLASGEPRPCLLYVDKQWSVRWIPEIEAVPMVISDEEEPMTSDDASDDPYCHIREFIDGVTLPQQELTLTALWAFLEVSSSIQKDKSKKFHPQWVKFLDEHNRQFRGGDIPE